MTGTLVVLVAPASRLSIRGLTDALCQMRVLWHLSPIVIPRYDFHYRCPLYSPPHPFSFPPPRPPDPLLPIYGLSFHFVSSNLPFVFPYQRGLPRHCPVLLDPTFPGFPLPSVKNPVFLLDLRLSSVSLALFTISLVVLSTFGLSQ